MYRVPYVYPNVKTQVCIVLSSVSPLHNPYKKVIENEDIALKAHFRTSDVLAL